MLMGMTLNVLPRLILEGTINGTTALHLDKAGIKKFEITLPINYLN